MNSLDKDYESDFSVDLFLLCKHQLNLPLTARDLMKMAKAFDFKKNTYIKQQSEMFTAALTDVLRLKYGSDTVLCTSLITPQEFSNLPQKCSNADIWFEF